MVEVGYSADIGAALAVGAGRHAAQTLRRTELASEGRQLSELAGDAGQGALVNVPHFIVGRNSVHFT